MNSGIYLITHIATGRQYVGQSRNLAVRKTTHASGNSSGQISRAIATEGWDAFRYAIIEVCPPEQLKEAEARWIAHFDCLSPKGFNLLKPGGRGRGNPYFSQEGCGDAGRFVSIVLTDERAIAALDKLAELHGGVKAAITAALHATAPRAKPPH